MFYLTIFTPKTFAMPSAEKMEQMGQLIERQSNAGTLLSSGALGYRKDVSWRVSRDGSEYNVTTAPSGANTLFDAGGFSIQQAGSHEQMLAAVREFLSVSGEGVVDIIALAFPPMIASADGKPTQAGQATSGLIPHLNVEGAAAAIELYQKAFGAELVSKFVAEDGERLMHSHLKINGGDLYLCDCFPEYGHPRVQSDNYTMHQHVADADAWWKRALDAGCEVVMPLENQFWGDYYGLVRDPFGVCWAVAQAK
ncbi:MAG: VOC family protein [Myxococcales bacterium]|nr:VOC family protein [Myxococcales bacterium]